MREFEKISPLQALNDGINLDDYNDIILPNRATRNSCGYDFYVVSDIVVPAHRSVKAPTGVRVRMEHDEVLFLHIRSSIGIKNLVRLPNSTGLVDSDYFSADNEGHMWLALINDGDEDFTIKKGERIIQGVFQKFLVTDSDKASGKRSGGVGSTKK